METFTDTRPAGAQPEWVGGVNYPIVHDQTGYRVTGTYSYSTGRYIMPGELVHVCDEFGYWRDQEPETFIGVGDSLRFYYAAGPDGRVHAYSSNVVRDIIPAT